MKTLYIIITIAIIMAATLIAYTRRKKEAAKDCTTGINNLFIPLIVDVAVITFTLNITTWWSVTIATYIMWLQWKIFDKENTKKVSDGIIKISRMKLMIQDMLSVAIQIAALVICALFVMCALQLKDGWNIYRVTTLAPLALLASIHYCKKI